MQYTATQHNGNMNVTKVDNEEWFKMSEVSIAQFEKITKSSSFMPIATNVQGNVETEFSTAYIYIYLL